MGWMTRAGSIPLLSLLGALLRLGLVGCSAGLAEDIYRAMGRPEEAEPLQLQVLRNLEKRYSVGC
jgi:hypothetical protein